LLAALSPGELELVAPHLESLAVARRHSIEESHRPIQHVYFMEHGIVSVVATGHDTEIEVGLIGREGMTGIVVLMGNHRSPHKVYVQVAGAANRIGVKQFREAVNASATLRFRLLKFAQSFMVQTAHTAIANGRANLEQRLARWMLMAHDRVDGDGFALTHEFIALMLGVRRAGVTVALNALEKRGLLRADRGVVTLVNRKGLEKVAGRYYGVPEAELQRLMGYPPLRTKN
jgi:CRP-like cAMP-binding protein